MGCGQSKVRKQPQGLESKSSASSRKGLHGIAASNSARRKASGRSGRPRESESSLVVCESGSVGGDDDDDNDERGRRSADMYNEHSRMRNSSSLPAARRPVEVKDHFAPVQLPLVLQSSHEGEHSPGSSPWPEVQPFRTALEDHDKTDSVQAEQVYRRALEQKREAQTLETALREMEEFDPIRPMDSFNVTHRGLLGRCWDRRAAELVPIAFLHAMQAHTSSGYSNELARDGSIDVSHLVRKELHVNASGDSGSDASPHSPDAGYPGVFPSRDWSALLHHPQSSRPNVAGGEVTDAASQSPVIQSPTTTHAGVPRRSHWFSVCGVASQSVPWRPGPMSGTSGNTGGTGGSSTGSGAARSVPASARAPNSRSKPGSTGSLFTMGARAEDDLVPGAGLLPPPEVLTAMPMQERIESFSAYIMMHERFTGAKSAFAFQLSGELDDGTDTRFLRKRNLKPSKGIQVVRWNRVEFFNPSLRTLTLAAMDASLGRYEARDQSAQIANLASAGEYEIEAELQAMGNNMFLDGNVSFGQHLLADIKNRSFAHGSVVGGADGKSTAAASSAGAANSSLFHIGTTLSEGKHYAGDGSKHGPEFPEESVLCLAMAVPTSRLFWGSQFRHLNTLSAASLESAAQSDADARQAKSVAVDILRNFSLSAPPVPLKEKNSTRSNATTASTARATKAGAVAVGGGSSRSHNVKRLVATPVSAHPSRPLPSPGARSPSSCGENSPFSPSHTSVTSPNTMVSPTLAAPIPMTHLVAFNISSFSASIDPFHWEAHNYTRFPVDVNVSKSANRKRFGEGVITDVMYGGTLVIECNSPEAGAELERMLDTVVWSESRSLRAITQGVRKRMKHRIAERASSALGHKKKTDEKEKSKSRDEPKKDMGKSKGKDKDKPDAAKDKAEADDGSVNPMGGYAFRIMRRIGGRPMRDAVELKHIAVYFSKEGVQETVLSKSDGAAAMAVLNSTTTGAGGGAEITPSFSRVASAWIGLETMAAVVETWGLHLLANPQFAQPISMYLQKFSGLVPVLQHTSLMAMSMGVSMNTSNSDEEGEEDRFFAPELEPVGGATGDEKNAAEVPAVTKRIPTYNRFYTSFPSTPVEDRSASSPSAVGGMNGRGPASSSTFSNDHSGGSSRVNGSRTLRPSQDPRRCMRNELVSFVGADDSLSVSRAGDSLSLSSARRRLWRGLPMTLSCETMPGATNVSLPASEMGEDEDDEDVYGHSILHSANGDTLPGAALSAFAPSIEAAHAPPLVRGGGGGGAGLARIETLKGPLAPSQRLTSTRSHSSSSVRRMSDSLGFYVDPNRSAPLGSALSTSGVYPTEDSFALPPPRAPTLVFCVGSESEAYRCSGTRHAEVEKRDVYEGPGAPHSHKNDSRSTAGVGADLAHSHLGSGCVVRPSRVIVKRRPSDDGVEPGPASSAMATAVHGKSNAATSFTSTDTSPTASRTDQPPLVNTELRWLHFGSSAQLPGTVSGIGDASLLTNAARHAEAEERWTMAMLEARALEAELEDMQSAVRAAQEELMVKEEVQRTLFRAFMPFTNMNRMEAMFLYLKTAIHEPDDLPHGCLYLDTPDWLSMLYAVWTSPRNHVRRVNIVYALMCKDLPKIGLLAGLLYFERSTAGLDSLTLNASKLFGTAIPAAETDSNSTNNNNKDRVRKTDAEDVWRRPGGARVSNDSDSTGSLAVARPPQSEGEVGGSAAPEGKKSKRGGGWLLRRLARRRDPANVGGAALHSGDDDSLDDDEASEEREAQRYQHYFLTHPQEGGPQLLHYGFGIVTPLYYVTAEQARDILWWLLCAIAENARCDSHASRTSSRRPSTFGSSATFESGKNTAAPDLLNAFTLRLAGLPRDKKHYVIPKTRSFGNFLHFRGASKEVKPTAVGAREWVDEDAMQLGSFIILSQSPSGFVFEDSTSPGSPLLSGTTASFDNDVELSADPRQRHKRGGARSAALQPGGTVSSFTAPAGSPLFIDLPNEAVALHEHNYGKRSWMHAEAKVEIRPFCHVLYHSCLPAFNAIEKERQHLEDGATLEDVSGPYVSHYHLPFNRVHNHAQYYLPPERRLDLLRTAAKAREESGMEEAGKGGVKRHASLEELLSTTPTHPFVFGLQSEEEERAVLLEEEGRLFRHTEDIWEVLRRSANKYNKSMSLRMANGDTSEVDELGLVRRPILLER